MSDHDFFFEEEAVEEVSTVAPKGGKAEKTAKTVRAAAPAETGGFFAQNVAMSIVALVGVICLLLGVIIGFFLAPKPVPTMTTIPGQSAMPPTLTDEQMQGGMPAGHPPIEGMPGAGGEATTTP